MKQFRFLVKPLLFLMASFLSIFIQIVDAQNKTTITKKDAEIVFDWYINNKSEKLYESLRDDLKRQISIENFKNIHLQTEKTYGKLKSRKSLKWVESIVSNIKMYHTDLMYGSIQLRFLVAFDSNGKLNTIRIFPAPKEIINSSQKLNPKLIVEKEIVFKSGDFELPGTLSLPKNKTQIPLLILVHGSGPNDRDETIGPNKLFKDIAWGLASKGIAVLRYDKRTFVYKDKSFPMGSVINYDTETVEDVVAAIQFAHSIKEIDSNNLFLLGHSLGGMLLPRVIEKTPQKYVPKGIISLAGSSRKMEELINEQTKYLASLSGDSSDISITVNKLLASLPDSYLEMDRLYNPVLSAQKLSVKMLFLQGERDYQVTMHDFGLWRIGLRNKKNTYFKSYPKLNHLMQEGQGRSTPNEYQTANGVPGYLLDDIAMFITKGIVQ